MTALLDFDGRIAGACRPRSCGPNLRPTSRPRPGAGRGTTVRLLVSRTAAGELSHHAFAELPDLLLPGDLLVVNNSATLPAVQWPAAGVS